MELNVVCDGNKRLCLDVSLPTNFKSSTQVASNYCWCVHMTESQKVEEDFVALTIRRKLLYKLSKPFRKHDIDRHSSRPTFITHVWSDSLCRFNLCKFSSARENFIWTEFKVSNSCCPDGGRDGYWIYSMPWHSQRQSSTANQSVWWTRRQRLHFFPLETVLGRGGKLSMLIFHIRKPC